MAKYQFEMIMIREGRETDYVDFTYRGVKKNGVGEMLHPDLVGFTVFIEADTLKKASSIVLSRHPKDKIDSKSVKRHKLSK